LPASHKCTKTCASKLKGCALAETLFSVEGLSENITRLTGAKDIGIGIALILNRASGLPTVGGKMKKEFFRLALNAILIASFSTGFVLAEEKPKKEKVQIVVVEKKDNNKSGNSGEQKKKGPATVIVNNSSL
jgi:hypothetical protein